MTYTAYADDGKDLVDKGYQVLGLMGKNCPPRDCTGNANEFDNDYFHPQWADEQAPSFIAVRHGDTFGLDIDTDTTAGHKVPPNPDLENLVVEFFQTFGISPVVTGANRGNHAGIYHWNYGVGVTEEHVKALNGIVGVDVLRKGHRYAVVRGIHPVTGNAYTGDLPPKDDLPVFTEDHLKWWIERLPEAPTPIEWEDTPVSEWKTSGEMCEQVRNTTARFRVPDGASRHDAYRDVLWRLACLGAAGHTGVDQSTERLAEQWEASGKHLHEFTRLLDIKRLPAQSREECKGVKCRKGLGVEAVVELTSYTNPVYAVSYTDDKVNTYLRWDGSRWTPLSRVQLKGVLSYCTSPGALSSTVQVTEGRASLKPVPQPEIGIIHCRNGVLNISTGEFIQHSRENVPGALSGVDYDPEATCPRFENEYLPMFSGRDEDTSRWILSYVKHVLTGGNQFEKFLILHGSGGTGKGTLLSVLMGILGDEEYSTTLKGGQIKQEGHEHDDERPEPALAKIEGKRLIIIDEIPQSVRLLDAAKIKAITGKSAMSVRMLHKAPRNITYTGQMIISTNVLPQFRDDVEGIDRRVILYNTPEREGAKDDTLKKDILDNELSGILNLILAADDWDGNLPPVVEAHTDKYIRDMNAVQGFMDSWLEPVERRANGLKLTDMYAAFCAYTHERRDGKALGRNTFKEGLAKIGVDFVTATGTERSMYVLTDSAQETMDGIHDGY